MVEKWEYKMIGGQKEIVTEKEMNDLGDDGWELVSVIPLYGNKLNIKAFFKRIKS